MRDLDEWELWQVVTYWRWLALRAKLRKLTPRQMLVPLTLCQIAGLALTHNTEYGVPLWLVGNFVIAGLGMSPVLLRPQRIRAHWI